ncbi:MAG: prepilin-type N-terminal cleavage/methylation domain-containing protein [Lachnospiraceae bacterium]|nr:prepilin-type N-terminal cleavage/methylation domain-containing protein [Lachnospiraceae bacterium]
MKKFMENNKGLSLVELLIALVIGAILVAGIGSIMIVSSRSFSSTSAEAGMQSSAQIVMDHIQDVVVDANKKITYSYTTVATPTAADWNDVIKDADIPDPESAITYKKLSVYTFNLNQVSSPDAFNQEENKHYDIIWAHDMSDDEKSIITFEQQDLTYDPGLKDIVETGGPVESEKLADNVKSFKCDLSDMETKRIIFVEMDFSKANGRYTYHVANNVSLRNKVALSTDSISVNKGVELETLALTAEPGMDLPLTIKKVVTRGNASNVVTYEFDGGDGGKTSAGTALSNPSTLHIDATERADIIHMNAVDSLGDKHPFEVYINRVKWTSDNAASLGESDDVEGIQLIDRPEHDEVDAGTMVPITVQLNSNPGAPGIDRTKPEKVTGEIKKVTSKTGQDITALYDVKLEPAGTLGWMLDVPFAVPKDAKIKIRLTADHSLADGGIATRTVPYPEADGVYKDLELTVTEARVAVNKSPFLRGMKGRVIYPDYLEQFFNEAGKSEWEQYKRIPQGQIDNHYLVWKKYAYRPAVEGSKNTNYANLSTGWTIFDANAVDEKYEDVSGYQAHGWNVINGGKEGNFHGSEFASVNPDQDTGIVFAIVVQYKQNNAVRWFGTSPAQTVMYGFREQIGKESDYAKYESMYDLGSFYKIDRDSSNDDYRDKIFGDPNGHKWLVWQKEACFDNLSYGGNDGGLSIKTYMSDKAFEGGESLGSKNNVEETWGSTPYTGDHNVYMARVLPMTEIKNKINNNFYKKLGEKEEERDYYIWPKFTYNNTAFDRTSGYLKFSLRQGNITLMNNQNSNNKMEGFIAYPAYKKDNGFEIPEHKWFYGKGMALDSVYTSVGERNVRHYNNTNYTGSIREDPYQMYIKVVDGVYYIKIQGLAVYKFNTSTERWEFVKTDKAEANLASGVYHNSKMDVFLPGPDSDEFFTGFKAIAQQANTEKRFADRMAIYRAYDGVSMLSKYKIAYYRKDSKYWVDIYTLDDKSVYRKYCYNENTEQWESKGNIFSANITIRRGSTVEYYYIPTKNDIEWFNYQDKKDWASPSSGFNRYRVVNGKWERFGNGRNDIPTQWYKYDSAKGELWIRFAYGNSVNADLKYNFSTNEWQP